jgi:Tol biopolymer transport system component
VNQAGDVIAFSTDRNGGEKDIYVGTLTGDALTGLVNLTEDVDYDCWRARFGPIDRDYAGL